MAHAFAAAVAEFADRVAAAAAFDQFDAQHATAAQRGRPAVDPAQVEATDAEHPCVGRHRCIEVTNHDAEPVEATKWKAHALGSEDAWRMACSAANAPKVMAGPSVAPPAQ
jgi:hypothetical protein